MRGRLGGIGVAGCVVFGFLGVGCAGSPGEPAGAGRRIEGGGPATLVADDMFPPDQRETRMARLDPDTREALGVESSAREMLGEDSWVVRTVEDVGEEQEAGEMVFRRLDDGSVALVSLVAETPRAMSSGQARYRFEPPLVMTPARLGEGEVFEDETDLRIVALDDEDDVIKTGSASRRLELIGRQEFDTGNGGVRTLRVRARFRLSLGATVVTNESTVWVEPGGGALAESTRRVVRVLGVPVQEREMFEQEASSVGE